jgi:hypothetical protein
MTGTHNKTEQPKPAPPSVVIRILASLENGTADQSSVQDYRRHLSRQRPQLILAVAVLERVCRIDHCQACEALEVRNVERCKRAARTAVVDEFELREVLRLVHSYLRQMQALRLRAQLRERLQG